MELFKGYLKGVKNVQAPSKCSAKIAPLYTCPQNRLGGGGGKCSAGILEQSMGTRNQVGIGLSYRPARLHRLAE